MNETFELPVQYKNETILLQAELQAWGYSHRILVMVDKQPVIFEPDEERNYRALVTDSETAPDIGLLKAIATTLESVFR